MSTEPQLPPHDENAERALLGSIMIDPDCFFEVSDIVKPHDFYVIQCKAIYEAITSLSESGDPVDVISISDQLKAKSNNDDVIRFASALANEVPTSINARKYATIVSEYGTRRRLITASGKIAGMAYDLGEGIRDSLGEAESLIFDVRGNEVNDIEKPSDYIMDYLHHLDRMQNHDGSLLGLSSGFTDIDRILDGFQAPHQYILAARPAMGKSAMGGNIASAAIARGQNVAFFALEMSTRQIIDRIISNRTKIPLSMVKKPWLLNGKTSAITEAAGALSAQKLFIDDSPGLTPSEIRAKCMRIHAQHGLDLVIIDHLHLVRPDRKLARADQEITEITQSFMNLGKQLNIPILTLAQLSRGLEHRQDKRPVMADLRESGGIEENAYAIMFLYRDEYYNSMSETPNLAEVIIAKNRDGATGTVNLYWNGRTTSFRDLKTEAVLL
jgi:replicative DNA helicase